MTQSRVQSGMDIATWIKQARLAYRDPQTRRLGLSQRELAEMAGLALATLQRAETGQNMPIELTVIRIADALGIQPPQVDDHGRIVQDPVSTTG